MNPTIPSHRELELCYEMEKSLSITDPTASTRGFFLPGTQFSLYEELLNNGFIRILNDNNRVVGFVVVAPPGHEITKRLLGSEKSIIWFDSDDFKYDPNKCYWIAKIAVSKDYIRKGVAKSLYDEVFRYYRGYTAVTATAVSPIRNHPSEAFHKALGFKAKGLFLSGKKGNLGDVVNIIWRL